MAEKCPYCNNDMEAGYIQCRDGVAWTKKKCPIAALSPLSASSIVLASSNSLFGGAAVEAHKCSVCKKIIINIS